MPSEPPRSWLTAERLASKKLTRCHNTPVHNHSLMAAMGRPDRSLRRRGGPGLVRHGDHRVPRLSLSTPNVGHIRRKKTRTSSTPSGAVLVARSTITDIELPPDGQLLFLTTLKYEQKNSAVLHVPASVPTAEHSPPETLDDQEAAAYKPRPLYAVPGLTIDHAGDSAPETEAFADSGTDQDEVLDDHSESDRGHPRGHHRRALGEPAARATSLLIDAYSHQVWRRQLLSARRRRAWPLVTVVKTTASRAACPMRSPRSRPPEGCAHRPARQCGSRQARKRHSARG